MAARKPLVLKGVQVQQVQPGDLVDASTVISSAASNLLVQSVADGGLVFDGRSGTTAIANGANGPAPASGQPTILWSTTSLCFLGWTGSQWLGLTSSAYAGTTNITTTTGGITTVST